MNARQMGVVGDPTVAYLLLRRAGRLLLAGSAILSLGCVAEKPKPSGDSEWYSQCEQKCTKEGRETIGVAETAKQAICYCGKELPSTTTADPSVLGYNRPPILGDRPRQRPQIRYALTEEVMPPEPVRTTDMAQAKQRGSATRGAVLTLGPAPLRLAQ